MFRRLWACLLLLGLAAPGVAQQDLEIIRLKHRSAEQLVPQLRPFVEPGGAISGLSDEILLRASAANRQQIRQLIGALDQAPRRLLITVKQDNESGSEAAESQASGSLGRRGTRIVSPGGGAGAGIEIRRGDDVVRGSTYGTRGRVADRVSQQVQVVEGGKAYINVGVSLPVRLRSVGVTPAGAIVFESTVFRDIGGGFYAEPRVSGDTVTLDITPTHDTPGDAGPGSARIQRLSTTVSGRLGEWMVLGGSGDERGAEVSGSARYSTRGTLETSRVLLKVEELP